MLAGQTGVEIKPPFLAARYSCNITVHRDGISNRLVLVGGKGRVLMAGTGIT